MAFLRDFVYYGSQTECPEVYLIWSGLSLLGHALGRKVWFMHGRYQILPNLYVALVGEAGSGKSSAKNQARQLFVKAFPDYYISASFQSHQDILDRMSEDLCAKYWKDEKGEYGLPGSINQYRPFYAICNELASLVSTDKQGMTAMLVDIFDENEISTGFKRQRMSNPERSQITENPFLSLLACAVPKWFMGNLKLDLFDGGLGRRLIITYSEKTVLVPDPGLPEGNKDVYDRMVGHLKACGITYGEIGRSNAAKSWWHNWYCDPKRFNYDDPILLQFHQTKHIQVLKVAIILAKSEDPDARVIDEGHLQMAVEMLDALEPNILRLTSGIGRNELAGVGAQLLDFLARMGGYSSEVQVRKRFNREMRTPEFKEVLQHYLDTQQLFMFDWPHEGLMRRIMALPGSEVHLKYNLAAKNGQQQPQQVDSHASSEQPSHDPEQRSGVGLDAPASDSSKAS